MSDSVSHAVMEKLYPLRGMSLVALGHSFAIEMEPGKHAGASKWIQSRCVQSESMCCVVCETEHCVVCVARRSDIMNCVKVRRTECEHEYRVSVNHEIVIVLWYL